LYHAPASAETAFRYQEGGIGAFYWSDEGFGYAITAKADRDPLLRIAETVTNRPPGGARAKIPPAPESPAKQQRWAYKRP
jgi:hypothetical protein